MVISLVPKLSGSGFRFYGGSGFMGVWGLWRFKFYGGLGFISARPCYNEAGSLTYLESSDLNL